MIDTVSYTKLHLGCFYWEQSATNHSFELLWKNGGDHYEHIFAAHYPNVVGMSHDVSDTSHTFSLILHMWCNVWTMFVGSTYDIGKNSHHFPTNIIASLKDIL